MPQLSIRIDDREIISLIDQLPPKKKHFLLKKLITMEMPEIEKISAIGRKRFLAFCKKRGINYRLLTEKEKERLIENVLHEAD